jgi:putative hydrolase of the HAD superfamily
VDIRAVAFDVNGTLVEIITEDDKEQIFRAAGHFLTYQGIDLRRHHVKDLYFQFLKEQKKSSPERYPEFDAVGIWRRIIDENMTDFTRSLPPEKLAQMPLLLAEMYRGISRKKLKLYPHVRSVLTVLQQHFPLALVTDAQSAWARGELHKVGLLGFFPHIVVSGDYGYRKPDTRLFHHATYAMGVAPEQTIYIGNDMHRDVYGAREAGMKTVMYDSDQGTKSYKDASPDFTITDHRDLLGILGLPRA